MEIRLIYIYDIWEREREREIKLVWHKNKHIIYIYLKRGRETDVSYPFFCYRKMMRSNLQGILLDFL